jgi:hypothetical protein
MSTIRIGFLLVALGFGLAEMARAETLSFRNDLAGTWIDISQSPDATPLNLANDDVADVNSPVGNALFPAGIWHVGNNGAIGFGASNELPPVTQPIPTNQMFHGDQAIAPFADDIGDDGGNVFWARRAVTNTRSEVLIIEWFDQKFDGSNDRARFEVQIFDTPGPDHNYAQMIYNDIEQPWPNGGAISTIGYQNGAAGFNDVQWSYHQAGAVSNGTVLSLVPEPSAAGLALALGWTLRRRS